MRKRSKQEQPGAGYAGIVVVSDETPGAPADRAAGRRASGNRKTGRRKRSRALPGRGHRPFASFLTAFFLTLAVLAAAGGVLVADRNTRRIGWSGDETSLAFSSQSQRLDVRMMGGNYSVDLGIFSRAAAEQARFCWTFGRIAPAPGRLCVEALAAGGEGLRLLYEKYLYGPARDYAIIKTEAAGQAKGPSGRSQISGGASATKGLDDSRATP